MTELPINNIICGNCIDVMSDWPDDCCDLIVTDIPYGNISRPSNGLRSFDKKDVDIITFDTDKFIELICRICAGSIYVFCEFRQISGIFESMISKNLSTRMCIWEKTNPSPINGDVIWLSGVECCVFGKKPRATFNRHCKNTVFRHPIAGNKLHPTMKPESLMGYLIESSSNIGDLVVDPCCGSGTTCLAARRLNRRYIGIDISEEYVVVSNKRMSSVLI